MASTNMQPVDSSEGDENDNSDNNNNNDDQSHQSKKAKSPLLVGCCLLPFGNQISNDEQQGKDRRSPPEPISAASGSKSIELEMKRIEMHERLLLDSRSELIGGGGGGAAAGKKHFLSERKFTFTGKFTLVAHNHALPTYHQV